MQTTKKIQECHCSVCDSEFKLVYNQDEVSSYHKFCPFCAEELTFDDEDEPEDDFNVGQDD